MGLFDAADTVLCCGSILKLLVAHAVRKHGIFLKSPSKLGGARRQRFVPDPVRIGILNARFGQGVSADAPNSFDAPKMSGHSTGWLGFMEVSVFRLRKDDGPSLLGLVGLVLALSWGPLFAQPNVVGYQLRPGDVVAVSVWQEPGLEQLVLVRPDGGVSFPLAGDLRAEGLTLEELATSIQARLRRYIPEPVVTVTLQEIPGNRIYVLGRVNEPGDFPIISRDITVMQALSMAGGLTPFAKAREIRVLRQVDGKEQVFPFDYRRAIRGEGPEQALKLQPGDVVVVP